MSNKLLLSIFLITIWFIISGFFKPLFAFFGVASVSIAVFISIRMDKVSSDKPNKIKTGFFSIKFLKYLLWLCKEMIISSFNIAVETLREKPNLAPQLKWVPHKLKNEESIAIYANSITLTPGTVCMYTKKNEVLVHSLQKEGMEELNSGKMHD